MRRVLALLLAACLLLAGCTESGMVQPVTFYYVCADYLYDGTGGVIGSEQREAYGHRDDLPYLLALYLIGPSEEGLAPLEGIQILSIQQTPSTVVLNLADTGEILTDVEYSLACACLTLTCLDLTTAETVCVNSGSRSVTMGAEDLILADNTQTTQTEETQ